MADFPAEQWLKKHRSGDLSTLEHPGRIAADALANWRRLASRLGADSVMQHHRRFHLFRRREYLSTYAGVPELKAELGRICRCEQVRTRTDDSVSLS